MRLRILGSFGGDSPDCRMTSFLLDDTVAIDAGAITRALSIEEQRRIRHIVLTHTHMDHTATVPFLIENIFGTNEKAVTIYSTARVLANVRRHLFNNDTWPDFSRIPNHLYPSVRFVTFEAGEKFTITGLPGGDLDVVPIPVNHVVPTVGLILSQRDRTIAFTSDTGPTEQIWKTINGLDRIEAVITECSFPNRLQNVADVSLHLTPMGLSAELEKLNGSQRILLYHFKPPYVEELRHEIPATVAGHTIEELVQDRVYTF